MIDTGGKVSTIDLYGGAIDRYHQMQATNVSMISVVYLVCVLVALYIAFDLFRTKQPKVKREVVLDRTEQERRRERSIIADAIHDALFELEGQGKLTRDRYKYWMHRAGNDLSLPDLLPKTRLTHPDALKAQFKRLKDKLQEKHNGNGRVIHLQTETKRMSKIKLPVKAA